MTTDHMELRTHLSRATQEAIPMADVRMTIKALDLVELLAAYDALLAAGTKKAKADIYTPGFEAAWDVYPTRPGNSKAAAFKAWKARLSCGWKPQDMIEGTIKYADYCKTEGTEPQYVKQASTFYGPGEHFSADWTPRAQQRRALPDRREVIPESDSDRDERRKLWGIPDMPPASDEGIIDATQ